VKVIANLDEHYHPYLTGSLSCSQYEGFKHVQFYLDTASTCTTLLEKDIIMLGIDWSGLNQSKWGSMTAKGPIYPFELPNVIIGLRTLDDEKKSLKQFPLKVIHLLPPDDPTSIFPVQYVFSYSLLGIDVLKKFKHWYWNLKDRELILER